MDDVRIEQFLNRLPASATAKHRETIATAFGLTRAFREKAEAVNADEALSPVGKREAIKKALGNGTLGHLSQLKKFVSDEFADASKRRAHFSPVYERPDAVGEMRAQEIRAYLRSLGEPERLRLVDQTRDAEILAAVMSAPALLSGIPDGFRAAIRERNTREEHGAELDAIDKLEAAAKEVETAIKVAADDLRRLSGLTESEFDELANAKGG